MWILFTVPMVGLLCVIVVFPEHTHLRFAHPLIADTCNIIIFLRGGPQEILGIFAHA